MESSSKSSGNVRSSTRLPLIIIAVALLGGALLIGLLANPGFRQAAPATPPIAQQPPADGSLPNAHGDPAAAVAAPRIAAADAKTRADAGTVVFVDVRSGSEYEAGHIANALSITSPDLDTKLKGVPAGTLIVTYCSQPAEAASARAVQIFKEYGYSDVQVLQGGLKGWQDLGYPIATGR